ncbi:MAG TPA: DUF6352 family protein [Burkholderiales bacterium]|nr:DUF6352 family protein [Burkholderiales bacterium]
MTQDFWTSSGYHLLRRNEEGRLVVTDDYLRLYFARPELALVPESCAAERALHERLLDEPRSEVSAAGLAELADEDARENYAVMLRFRDQLLEAPTLEAFYDGLFRRDVAVPPDFIHHTVQVILRGILDGVDDGLEARAAEIFFREQSIVIPEGAVMFADRQTVHSHASSAGLGDFGRLMRELQQPLTSAELDVLDRSTATEYFSRDERYDLALQMNPGSDASRAFARVLERWIAHFHGIQTQIEPVREIPDEDWLWHVGLDAEATAMLNDLYNGGDVDEDRMKRIVGLYRLEFRDAGAALADLGGAPVFLGLATTPQSTLRMKPQNLLMNLPLARRV